jgi:hypothetical protein
MTEEEKKVKQQAYYQANKDKIKAYKDKNKAVILEQKKQYREANKDKIKEYSTNYTKANKDKIKQYQEANKDSIKEYKKEYIKIRRENDPLFKLSSNIRKSIRSSVKNSGFKKISRTEQILGCSFDELKIHLESKFEKWMNWENQGNPKDGIVELNKTWDIDHIIPLSTATNEIELLALNHYSNLQPLCSYTNRYIKRNNPS